ncbi:MAG: GNAT family N-acetyltransferase [Thermoflexales bacterium]|nr:GNAT family N-acetyltransferase [Thermoflexales bacterium]
MPTENLYTGKHVHLTVPDPDTDVETESLWSHTADYDALLRTEVKRPVSVHRLKKRYEDAAKEPQNDAEFDFRIRLNEDERLVGELKLWADWALSDAWMNLGIGLPGDRRKGFGSDALRLTTRYVFDELNLRRITTAIPGYNEAALAFLTRHGFKVEVRSREALFRFGRRWDSLGLGLLRADWEALR